MLKLTAEQRALLTPRERVFFSIADRVNRVPALKAAATQYLRSVSRPFVRSGSGRLLQPTGLENLTNLSPDRGVLVASNHRSFFDLYVISDQLLRSCPWIARMYFPVRSDYFYTHATGTLVNAAMSMLAMYPPIFRDPSRRTLNDYAIDVLKEECSRVGTVIGIHPEGTRGTGDDPYTLLPAKPGTGEIVYHANPIVVPVFLLGLGNDLPKQIRSNFDGRGEPITVVYGKPLDLSAWQKEPPTVETYKAISNVIREAIIALGEDEKALRKARGLPPPRAARARQPANGGASPAATTTPEPAGERSAESASGWTGSVLADSLTAPPSGRTRADSSSDQP
jgi:1-acyl-sn-glycerol-3-phosphate acyltransferase